MDLESMHCIGSEIETPEASRVWEGSVTTLLGLERGPCALLRIEKKSLFKITDFGESRVV